MNSISQLKDVKKELEEFNKGNCKCLGKKLGLGIALLEEVNADNKLEGAEECLTIVMKHWLGKNYANAETKPPTWQNIAQAVKEAGDTPVADAIKKAPIMSYT